MSSFEEAIEAEKARLLGEGGKTSEREGRAGGNNSRYLSRGIYVDQLLRWWKFFDKEQTLVPGFTRSSIAFNICRGESKRHGRLRIIW